MIKGKMPDVKKLLEKGKLTGWELGRLILMDNVEHDHGRPVILAKEDVRAIKRRLEQLDPKEARDFNRLQNLYQVICYTIQEGVIEGLEAAESLNTATDLLKKFHLEDTIRKILMFKLPAIVTKKQYEELRAKEREFKLSQLKSMRGVLENLIHELAPEEAVERWENPKEGETDFLYLTDFLADSPEEKDRAIVKEAAEWLIRLIREGTIQPVLLPEKAVKKLKKAQDERENREALIEDGEEPPDIKRDVAKFIKEEARQRAEYEEGRAKMTEDKREAIIKILEGVADHSILLGWGYTDKEDDLLEFSYCTGREVYEAGVKKWMNFVDTYKGNYEPGSQAREDFHSMVGVAILEDPPEYVLDERGYFNDAASRALGEISEWAFFDEKLRDMGDSFRETLKRHHNFSRMKIKKFLSIKMILEAVSAAVGVDFTEDLERTERRIQLRIDLYNSFTQPMEKKGEGGYSYDPPHYLGLPKLKALKIGKLKPTASSIQYYKERMAISLGEGWYETAIKTVEYETDEGSLAEEVATDLTILNALDEHKKRGGHHGRDK